MIKQFTVSFENPDRINDTKFQQIQQIFGNAAFYIVTRTHIDCIPQYNEEIPEHICKFLQDSLNSLGIDILPPLIVEV